MSGLQLQHMTMRFGGLTAVGDLDAMIEPTGLVGLIGPNGAGKTTVFNVVTGVYQPTEGEVRFQGRNLAGLKRHQITALGLARTFQNIRLFAQMTALENVLVGTDTRHRTSVPGAMLHFATHGREEREGRERAMELLELATEPRVLLLDEPAAGFNPAEKAALAELIGRIRDAGYTILLIEHDMGLVMRISDWIAVLDFGEKIAEGLPS